jgi:hypothetical protein
MNKKKLITEIILRKSISKNENINLIKYLYLKSIIYCLVTDGQSCILKECESDY